MAFNKEFTDDFRPIDLTLVDYVSEKGKLFVVYAGGAGDIVMVNPATDTNVTVTVVAGSNGTFYTTKVIKLGTDATGLIAKY